MAAVDTRLFKLFFEAIERFYKNPNIGFVVTSGRFISKKAALRFFRNLLPQYRAITDDNELIEQLYLNQTVDFNLKNLLIQKEPVLPENLHSEFDQIGKLSQDKQDQALIKWAERVGKPPHPIPATQEARQLPKIANLLKKIPVFKISPQAAVTVFSAGVGSIAGYGAAGGTGAAAGALLGAAAPSFIKSGGGGVLLQGGGLILNTTANLLSGINLVKVGIPLLASPVLIWGLVIGLGLILLTGLIGTTGLIPAGTTPGAGATPLTPYTPGAAKGIVGCPVNGAIVGDGSKEAGGHCSPAYVGEGFVCPNPGEAGYQGKETAIDITGTNKTVYLPKVGGNIVDWIIEEDNTPIATSDKGGIAVSANTTFSGKNYRIRFVHIEKTLLKRGDKVSSETLVGQYNKTANHVHITIQENTVYKPADLYFNLCQ